MKSFENTFETRKVCLSCSIWLENHFSTFPDWKQENFEYFFEIFFFWKKLRKRRIVPKNEKGGSFGFINILSVAKYQKIRRGELFWDMKIFKKKIRSAEKKMKGGTLWSLPVL